MLRTLALGLGVANALLLAAQFGVYERLLGRPDAQEAQREPARLQRQLHPEVLQVLTPQAASAALAAAAASAAASSAGAAACLEAGPFSGTEAEAAERTLRDAGLPPASWQALRTEDGGAYLVYMGRYADRETLQRKLEEVKRRKVEVEEINDDTMENVTWNCIRYQVGIIVIYRIVFRISTCNGSCNNDWVVQNSYRRGWS